MLFRSNRCTEESEKKIRKVYSMGAKKIILLMISFILVISVIVTNTITVHKDSEPESVNGIMKEDNEEWDLVLQKQKYLKSDRSDESYVAVIVYHNNEAEMKQFLVENKGTINITVPKDSNYIISLPANSTVAYSWNRKNEINDRVVAFDQQSWTENPMPKKDMGKVGVSYARQNFYFHTKEKGKEKLIMRYEHLTEQREEFLEVTFHIKVK